MNFFAMTRRLGWPLVILLCALPLLRWVQVTQPQQAIADYEPIMIWLRLGQMTGILGLALYAINLLLSSRLSIFENLFGGLNKVYIAHHIIGAVALLALLVHPIALALRLMPSSPELAARLFIPSTDNLPVAYGIVALFGMILLLVITFFIPLAYRTWLSTHKWLGFFFCLASLHVFLNSPSELSDDPLLNNYLLGLVLLGLVSFTYRTLLPKYLVRQRYPYIVVGAESVAKDTLRIDLKPDGVRSLKHRAGQFLFISMRHPGLSNEWHPFTISSAPGSDVISLTVKGLGIYTWAMVGMGPAIKGAKAMLEGPYGRFELHSFSNLNQVWIAGGIGVTPFLSLAKSLKNEERYSIDLYYSVKSDDELVEIPELQECLVDTPERRFRVIPFVSNTQGFLTADVIEQQCGSLLTKDFLICGPPPLMKAMRGQLEKKGVKSKQIHTEEFALS